MNGLKLILDVESFDYAFTDRGALGFRMSTSDARDQEIKTETLFLLFHKLLLVVFEREPEKIDTHKFYRI